MAAHRLNALLTLVQHRSKSEQDSGSSSPNSRLGRVYLFEPSTADLPGYLLLTRHLLRRDV